MKIETHHTADALILHVGDDRLDAAAAVQFKDAVRAATHTPDRRIILDLSRVDFMDSSGLGALIGTRKMLDTGQTLELACLRAPVAKVLKLTRMDSLFVIHDALPAPPTSADGAEDAAHAV